MVEAVRNSGISRAVELCRTAQSVPQVRALLEHAGQTTDIRSRYASLLLLDNLLHRQPHLKHLVTHEPLISALAAIEANRPAKVKWLLTAMLPKTDMHVHIDGSVRIKTVVDLASEQGVDLSAVLEAAKKDELKGPHLKGVPRLPKNPTYQQISDLSQIRGVQPDFLKMLFLGFDFAIAVMQTKEGLRRAAYELVEDSAREGVMYLNAIFAPCLHQDKGLSYDEVVEATIAGLEEGKQRFGVGWELSLAIYRGVYTKKHPEHPLNTSLCAERWAKRYPSQIAIDVVGAEFETPLAQFRPIYAALKDSGVILRAHAGEGPGQAKNILTALEMGVKRIGHGIHLGDLDAESRRRVLEAKVIFEVAPVSNIKCLCLGDDILANTLMNHPIDRMLRFGATLCTDDRTVMMTDNVTQLLELERELRWTLFGERCVALTPVKLFNNGVRAIASRMAAGRVLSEGRQVFWGINDLMAALANQSV